MWDTSAFLMDFGTYCYVVAIEIISGSIFLMISRTEVPSDINYVLISVSSSSFLPGQTQ